MFSFGAKNCEIHDYEGLLTGHGKCGLRKKTTAECQTLDTKIGTSFNRIFL